MWKYVVTYLIITGTVDISVQNSEYHIKGNNVHFKTETKMFSSKGEAERFKRTSFDEVKRTQVYKAYYECGLLFDSESKSSFFDLRSKIDSVYVPEKTDNMWYYYRSQTLENEISEYMWRVSIIKPLQVNYIPYHLKIDESQRHLLSFYDDYELVFYCDKALADKLEQETNLLIPELNYVAKREFQNKLAGKLN